MDDKDRIKLAEAMDLIRLLHAMGWTHAEEHSDNPEWRGMWFKPDGSGPMPRPKLDANFDYAVLEWMRKFEFTQKYRDFIFELRLLQNKRADLHPMLYENYQIGDYARAALKVIDDG